MILNTNSSQPSNCSIESLPNLSEENLNSNKTLSDPRTTQIVPNIYFSPCIYDLSALGKQNWKKEKFRICYINGICTSFTQARGTALHLSELSGGINIFGVYNPSYSLIGDIFRSISLFAKQKSKTEELLHQLWDDFFSNSDSQGCLLQVCSSQGGIIVRNALLSYSPERRQRIFVLALAPAVHINPELCQDITSLQTFFDPVPKLDLIGLCCFHKTITLLNSHNEVLDIIDHSPYSSSFMEGIQQSFLNLFLTTKCLDKEHVKFRSNAEETLIKTRYQPALTLKKNTTCLTLNIIETSNTLGAIFGPEVVNQWEHCEYKLSRSCIGRLEQVLNSLDKVFETSVIIYILVNCSSLSLYSMAFLATLNSIDLFSYLSLQISHRNQYQSTKYRKISVLSQKISYTAKLFLQTFLLSLPKIYDNSSLSSSSLMFLTGRISSGLIACSFEIIPPLKIVLFKTIVPRYTEKNSTEKFPNLSINLDAKLFTKANKIKNTISDILLVGTTFIGCVLILNNEVLNTTHLEDSNITSNHPNITNSTCLDINSQLTFPFLGLSTYTSLLAAITLTKITRLAQFFLKKSKKKFF